MSPYPSPNASPRVRYTDLTFGKVEVGLLRLFRLNDAETHTRLDGLTETNTFFLWKIPI